MIGKKLQQPQGRFALTNGRIILPQAVASAQALVVEEGKIAGITDIDSLGGEIERVDVGGRTIAPGLIDIHNHGALGHTFNDATEQAFATLTEENVRCGVTSLLATTVTASISELQASLACGRQWMLGHRDGSQILGMHVEGPYFNPAQGGAQNPVHFRNPDDGTPEQLLQYHDVIKIMTYAPELPGALELTQRLVELDILPAAGHSDAREEDVLPVIEAGLSHMIHIWSAQSTTVREGPWRKPGLLEVSLTYDGLTGEMIADGKHLPPTLMKLVYKCIDPDRLCIISDVSSGAGLPEGARFRMGGIEFEVHDGVGMLLDRTAFASSTTMLNQMIPIVADTVGVPLEEAIRMASLTPARVIGVDDRKGSLEAGKDSDVAIFEDDFGAWRTMIRGQWAYAAS